jgi:hypothetical protein
LRKVTLLVAIASLFCLKAYANGPCTRRPGICENIADPGQGADCSCVRRVRSSKVSIDQSNWHWDSPGEPRQYWGQPPNEGYDILLQNSTINGIYGLGWVWPRDDSFVYPEAYANEVVAYVLTTDTGTGVPLSDGTFISDISSMASIRVSAVNISLDGNTPTFNYNLQKGNTCASPIAEMHVFLGEAGWTNDETEETYMAIESIRPEAAGDSWDMVDGLYKVTIPLMDPARWIFRVSGATADTNLPAFRAILANLSQVGVTFGGGCFYAHGVNTSFSWTQFLLTSLVFTSLDDLMTDPAMPERR